MRLNEFGIATTGTICVVSDYGDLIRFDPTKILPDSWAIKPARGSQGDGILLAVRREGNNWYKGSGSVLTPDDVKDHVRKIVDGQFAGDAEATDTALIEPLIRCHQDVADLVPEGLPDLRLISLRDEPLMAMMRLPTNASDGKANLHQHGIGAGVSLETGIVTHAMQAGVGMDCHPDTGKRLVGFQVPHWEAVLELASKCGSAIGLGYCGVDIVLDDKLGPLVLEINAHPGLEIQNINREGLRKAMVIMGEKL
jgi:alpha-L-glutamate ligase-like protein